MVYCEKCKMYIWKGSRREGAEAIVRIHRAETGHKAIVGK